MNELRSWLERNKVFFETIAALALSIMATVVSVAGVSVAARQNALIELQLQAERLQLLPHLQLDVAYEMIENENGQMYATTEKIIVTNYGGVARSIGSTAYVVMDVFLDGTKKSFPLGGYYWTTFHFDGAVGKLLEITREDNNKIWSDLERGYRELAKEEGHSGIIELRRVVRLRYQDVFGETHVEYHLVEPLAGGSLIPQSEGEEYAQEYWPAVNRLPLELDSLTPELLIDLVSSPDPD